MRKLIKTEVLIDAPAERVWAQLTDFASFPGWNPFIRRAEGRLEPGEQLKIRLRLPNRLPVSFAPRITRVEPNRELRWQAKVGMRGLFDVERIFQIEPYDGGVRFSQSEVCTGLLTPLMFAANLEAQLYGGYDALNRALRARAEAGA